MMQRAATFLQKDTAIWGPIFLLCTLSLGAKTAIPFDLLFIALSGLYLSARWKMRGCCYALALLAIAASIKHALISDHLFQLGIEGSLGCAFFVTALACEQGASLIETLTSQIQTRKAALENLEEEIAKLQETSQSLQISFQEKAATLQKELEDLQTDHSSLLILNEVLRKTSARHLQENERLAANAQDLQHQEEMLRAELDTCRQDLIRFTNTEATALQNKQLFKELNAARYEKEQTYLINETLARLYARESLKAKDANEEASALSSQLSAATHLIQPLQEELIQTRAALEKSVKSQQTDNQSLDFYAQEKMMHLSQMEPLFKQLKKQFEEKNQVLQQTRSELFKSDTELQRLQLEKAALELNPIPREVEAELQGLGEQIQVLEEENQQLQELITLLTKDSPDAARQKKN